MPLILPGNVASATAATTFSVDNSCRFNDDDTAYLDHTHGAVTSTRKNTFSFWVKRGLLSSYQYIISTKNGTSTNRDGIAFNDSDQIDIRYNAGPSSPIRLTTNRVFRDCSAFYHIVVAVDTEQSTESNRIKVYVNGTQETSFATSDYMDEDYDFALNSKTDQATGIGVDGRLNSSYFDGYMAEFVAIDGTQNAVTDFGEFDEDSPTIWKPKNVSGLTFGNAGFYMNFQTAAELGTDVSGNSNTFTENNLDATDQAIDTPTNNFCTMNPLDNEFAEGTFSEGNCKVASSAGNTTWGTATIGLSAGLWYYEVKFPTGALGGGEHMGIIDQVTTATDKVAYNASGGKNAVWRSGGNLFVDDSDTGDWAGGGDLWVADDIMGVFIDLEANKIYAAINGTMSNSGAGEDITAATSTLNGVYFPIFSDSSAASTTFEFNFGGCSAFALSSAVSDSNNIGNFEFSPNQGGASNFDSSAKNFLAICSKNLGSDGG